MSRRAEDNENWGGARPGAGRPPGPSVKVSLSLDREMLKHLREACELQEGRTINNGEFEEKMQSLFEQAAQAFIEAPKPEPKWTVYLFWDGEHDGKMLREVKDLSEKDALEFAVAHQNAEVDGYLCNRIIAQQQGSRTNERRWSARHGKAQQLRLEYRGRDDRR
jgi:hypothetical protein